jgi:hypothetical protein
LGIIFSQNRSTVGFPSPLQITHTMGKLDAADDDDSASSLSPEDLVLKAVSSQSLKVDEENQISFAAGSPAYSCPTNEPAKTKCHDGTNAVVAADTVPPPPTNLVRASHVTLPPGAYRGSRGGGVVRLCTQQQQHPRHQPPQQRPHHMFGHRCESFSDHDNTSSAPSFGDFFGTPPPNCHSSACTTHHNTHHRLGKRTILEATLVTEREDLDGSHISEQALPSEYNAATATTTTTPIYKGEPILYKESYCPTEDGSDTDDKSVIPIRKSCLWSVALATCILLLITGASIAVTIVQITSSSNGSNVINPDHGVSTKSTNTTSTTIAHNNVPDNNAPIETVLAGFDRITHHMALVTMSSPAEQCWELRDAALDETVLVTAGTVTLSCGSSDETGHAMHPATAAAAAIFVHDMVQCQRIDQASVRCPVDASQQSIQFTCGTYQADYETDSAELPIRSTTAFVLVHPTVTECNIRNIDGDDNTVATTTSNDSYRPDHVPVVAVFAALGRLCTTSPNANDDDTVKDDLAVVEFGTAWNGTCADHWPLVMSAISNVSYCLEQQLPCSMRDCPVYIDRVGVHDTNTNNHCQAPNLESSILFGRTTPPSVASSASTALVNVQNDHATFVQLYLDRWFCNEAVVDTIVQRPPELR